jgi:hypothetical protein
MDYEQLREVGESIEKGDTIRIGRLDVPLTVTDRPVEDNTGTLLLFAAHPNHPEEGLVTNISIALGHPSGGENLDISVYEMEETNAEFQDYQIGDTIEMNQYALEELAIVE